MDETKTSEKKNKTLDHMCVIGFPSANVSGLDISLDSNEDSQAPILCHNPNKVKVTPGTTDRSSQLFWCGCGQITLGDRDYYYRKSSGVLNRY